MTCSWARALPLLALLLLLDGAQAARKPSKCSACRAVAEELVRRLEEEAPRNHLDLRHRLDEQGKRWGKVIDYKMSELRVIHLLEGLCEGLGKQYDLVDDALASAQGAQRWARSDSLGPNRSFGLGRHVKEQRRELDNYCHDLVERHEDALSAALRGGKVGSDSASDFLCLETAQHCQQAQAAEDAARAEAEAAREAAERAKAEAEAAKAEAAAAQVAAAAAEMEKAGGGAPAQQEQVAEDGSAAVATAGSVKREEL